MEYPDCRLTDAHTLAALLRSLPDGGELSLAVTGESMVPLYRHRETVVTLRREPARAYRRGDAVFFLRADGTPVLHRVVKVTRECLIVGGDAQRWTEAIHSAEILARVVRVRRRPSARDISTDALGYRTLVALWSRGRWWHPRVARWYRTHFGERRLSHERSVPPALDGH